MREHEPEGVALIVDDDEVFRTRLCRFRQCLLQHEQR